MARGTSMKVAPSSPSEMYFVFAVVGTAFMIEMAVLALLAN
jgi:hypothetical protein